MTGPEQPIVMREPDWEARIRHILTTSGRAIADILVPNGRMEEIEASLIKMSDQSFCARLTLGSKTAFLKSYDGDRPGTLLAFNRERDVLAAMKTSGLVPRLHIVSEAQRWLLMEEIPRRSSELSAYLAPDDFGYRVGTWIAEFEAIAPFQAGAGNWLGYLQKLGLGPQVLRIENAADTLRQIPLCGSVIARNDATLHNYLLTPENRLIGCDFESASLKPRGWEYLMTWHSLMERYGDYAGDAIDALSDGFDKSHRGGLISDELNHVARILFLARFLQLQDVDRRVA
ncbi:MAG: hypothetical protein AB3N23_08445 [Paracoccaceae bacterium]